MELSIFNENTFQERFNFIVLNDILEHVNDPCTIILSDMYKSLSRNTIAH
jgi:2-polyprenyl-3-methyl-5-hydroxy-6-metoxy-1,4-benzoquinol methylase